MPTTKRSRLYIVSWIYKLVRSLYHRFDQIKKILHAQSGVRTRAVVKPVDLKSTPLDQLGHLGVVFLFRKRRQEIEEETMMFPIVFWA